jgi:molybdate transport system substrate-binding protein
MKKIHFLIALVILVFVASCSSEVTPAPVTEVPNEVVPSTAPSTEVVLPTQIAQPQTLTVLAASSLTEAFTEIAKSFESLHPGVSVVISFANSQLLAQQLAQGAPADIFASASLKYMQSAVDTGRVAKDSAKVFARNKLIVIYPKTNPAQITSLQDLVKPGIKIVMGDKTIPIGSYALTFLENASKDAEFTPGYKDNVLANVVSYEDNVKSVVTKVILGEADAGIVYFSDVSGEPLGKVSMLTIPDALNVVAEYPIAVVSDSKVPELAKEFIDFVLSMDGQAVLAKYGFLSPSK